MAMLQASGVSAGFCGDVAGFCGSCGFCGDVARNVATTITIMGNRPKNWLLGLTLVNETAKKYILRLD